MSKQTSSFAQPTVYPYQVCLPSNRRAMQKGENLSALRLIFESMQNEFYSCTRAPVFFCLCCFVAGEDETASYPSHS